jgi:preprotein translocase subunit SecF
MFVVRYRKLWYAFSIILVVGSVFSVAVRGLQYGVDFTGGTILSLRFQGDRPSSADVERTFDGLDVGTLVIQPVGDNDMNIRMKTIDEETHQAVLSKLRDAHGEFDELRFDAIGPAIGAELQGKAWKALIVSAIAILAYIAYAFRKASLYVQNWKYGVVTVITAVHDVVIPIGVFSLLSGYEGMEVGTPFVVAILTVLGYSINDTIVVLDRVRENLHRVSGSLADIVGASLRQAYVRSLNTSLTTLLALAAVFLFGGASLKSFALALIIGIVAGAYSSIFVSAPLLVTWNKLEKK